MSFLNGPVLVIVLIYLIHLGIFNPETEDFEINISDLDYFSSKLSTKQDKDTTFQVPDEIWTSTAIKDIAYYLRNYKFNAWDQRYYNQRPDDNTTGYYVTFPIPALRSLHWKVHKNCEINFYRCITYLHSVIEMVPFGRNEVVVTFLNKNSKDNVSLIKTLNLECKETMFNSERTFVPFDSFKEKFQWCTTASYFMCWYTMLGIPALSMLGEPCDNFANCLDPIFGQRNRDPRSDDRLSFACAIYSFCPDPCCPMKHIHDFNECHQNILNPCFRENYERHSIYKKCTFDKNENQNLKAMINNKWNVSCNCKNKGFIWKSQFGICIDVNECLENQNMCDSQTEDCLNILGSYRCVCKLNYELDINKNKCIVSRSQINLGV